jgi:hypothetical protein
LKTDLHSPETADHTSSDRSGSIFDRQPSDISTTYPQDFTKPGNRFRAVAWFRPVDQTTLFLHDSQYTAEQARALAVWLMKAAEHIDQFNAALKASRK